MEARKLEADFIKLPGHQALNDRRSVAGVVSEMKRYAHWLEGLASPSLAGCVLIAREFPQHMERLEEFQREIFWD